MNWACYVLQFAPDSPFAQFKHITIQDGTSYAIKPSLKGIWPGRFTATNPAAVELHVSLDLLTEMVNFATLTPTLTPRRNTCPARKRWREDCCSRIAGTSRSSI